MKSLVRITKRRYNILTDDFQPPELLGEVIVDSRDCPDCDVRSFILMCIKKTIDMNWVCDYTLSIDFPLNGLMEVPYYNYRIGFNGYLVISVSSDLEDATTSETFIWRNDSSGGHISRIGQDGRIYLTTASGEFAKFCETYDV